MTLNPKLHPFTAIRNGQVLGHFTNAAAAIQKIQLFDKGFRSTETEVHNRLTGKSITPSEFLAILREAETERKRKARANFI